MSTDVRFSPIAFPSLPNPETNRIEALAKARGHAAGYTAGLRLAEQELARHRAVLNAEHAEILRQNAARVEESAVALAAAIHAADERSVAVVQDAQYAIAAAALELAEAVIGRELNDDATSARAALERVLSSVPPEDQGTIRMNPDDIAALEDTIRTATNLEFIADPTLERGDALASLPHGYLDARIGTALERARAVLLDGTP